MMTDVLKKLTAFLLLVAVLLAPWHSYAYAPATATDTASTAEQVLSCCFGDQEENKPTPCSDRSPCSDHHSGCDHEECCPDAEPPVISILDGKTSDAPLFPSNTETYIPAVYFAIFVPPEA